jgi:ribonuclease P protein component
MAARDRRLRRARDFQAVWQSRWAVRLPMLVLRFARRPDSPGRIGIVVSKVVAKKATDRNRLKRRLRNILVRHTVPVGIDAVLITQRGAPTLEYDQLTQSVDRLFSQAFAPPRGHRQPAAVSKNPVA